MKALIFKRYGGPDQVTFADIPRPVPEPDEILVQVHAAGLNPVDNKIREGKMKSLLRFQGRADGVASAQGARQTRPQGVHPRRRWRHWDVCDPTRETPRR